MPMIRCLLLLLLGAMLMGVPAGHTQSAIRKCISPSGVVGYTDGSCEELKMAPALQGERGGSTARIRCAVTLQSLMSQLAFAIQTQDVNRIAELYDWHGVSTRTSYGVMDRLDGLTGGHVLGIEPVFRELAPPPPPLGADGQPLSILERSALAGSAPRTRRVPTGLRVQSMQAQQGVPDTMHLGVRRYFGCWWITL